MRPTATAPPRAGAAAPPFDGGEGTFGVVPVLGAGLPFSGRRARAEDDVVLRGDDGFGRVVAGFFGAGLGGEAVEVPATGARPIDLAPQGDAASLAPDQAGQANADVRPTLRLALADPGAIGAGGDPVEASRGVASAPADPPGIDAPIALPGKTARPSPASDAARDGSGARTREGDLLAIIRRGRVAPVGPDLPPA